MNPYVGEIRLYAGTRIPNNWAVCDGRLLNVFEYEELNILIGNTYGGDGFTTFGLPDMRGRVPVHAGKGVNILTEVKVGQYGGSETIKVESKYMSGHTHGVLAMNVAATTADPAGNMMANGENNVYVADTAPTPPPPIPAPTPAAMNASTVAPNDNAGTPVEVSLLQPYMAINFIISLKGIM